MNQGDLLNSLGPLDLVSCILAASGHDVAHPALTNRFLVSTRDNIAIKYNDNSVLENMHCAKTYQIMQIKGCNIFEGLDEESWFRSRKLIIEMILATDMSKHFEILGKFRTRVLTLGDLNSQDNEDKNSILSMGVKCADLGHSAKCKELHQKWTELVCEEFFKQGDIEKSRGLPVSMYCDRETTDVPKSQAGFIKNICLPLFEVWCTYLSSEEIYNNCYLQLKENLQMWKEKSKNRRSTMQAVNKRPSQEPLKPIREIETHRQCFT